MDSIIYGIAAFIVGLIISSVNYFITRALTRRVKSGLMISAILRQAINIGYLAGLYFLSESLMLPLIPLLLGGVVGITVALIYFTCLSVRDNKKL